MNVGRARARERPGKWEDDWRKVSHLNVNSSLDPFRLKYQMYFAYKDI